MFNNIFKKKDSVADMIAQIAEADYKAKMEELKGQQHKIDKNKNNKIDAHDFAILRGEKKAMKKEEVDSVEEANNPFDVKNYKSQLKSKPGEKAGFDSKKTSTGTVYSRKPVKDEPMKKEEIDPNKTTVDTLKGREKTSDNKFLSKKVMMDVPDNVKEEAEQVEALRLIENSEIINEVSVGAKIRAYAQHSRDAFDHNDMGNYDDAEHHNKRADKILAHIQKHHGQEAVKHAEKAANSAIFGRDDPHGHGDSGQDRLHGGLRRMHSKSLTKTGKIAKNTQKAMKNVIHNYGSSRINGPKGRLPEEVEQIDERELTKGETAEKERIVKGMKKSLKGFKARYGERAKEVMYATATKAAKKD